MAAVRAENSPSSPASSAGSWDVPAEMQQILRSLPTRADLEAATDGLRASMTADMQALREDIRGVTDRLAPLEQGHEELLALASTHEAGLLSHSVTLTAMARHVEDLENRGRRNNIRVRGLPESESSPADLLHTLTGLFNSILERDLAIPIEMERWHRALRPRGPAGSPPRDVICCLLRFAVKEDILSRGRKAHSISHEGSTISLFQDLSPVTLNTRRALRPFTMELQRRDLQYRWLHPFGIQVRTPSGPHVLRSLAQYSAFITEQELPGDLLQQWPDPLQAYLVEPPKPQRFQQNTRRRRRSDGDLASQPPAMPDG